MSDTNEQVGYAASGRPLILVPDRDGERVVARAIVDSWVALLTLYIDEDGDLVQSIDLYERVGAEYVLWSSPASTIDDWRRPTEEQGPEELGLETVLGPTRVGLRSMRYPPSFHSDDSLDGFALQQFAWPDSWNW